MRRNLAAKTVGWWRIRGFDKVHRVFYRHGVTLTECGRHIASSAILGDDGSARCGTCERIAG